ncbi:hypothetical protein EVAR_77411_1 [Eumeta japonica]|uniref:Uncharacterized protein n=1 Tax=Eumeta variegata TaxID=151549 RepID=A0A4C1UXE1_EUMVA|nr:hypothetical protein EVAR_77411_1 [Eumeta japonica]
MRGLRLVKYRRPLDPPPAGAEIDAQRVMTSQPPPSKSGRRRQRRRRRTSSFAYLKIRFCVSTPVQSEQIGASGPPRSACAGAKPRSPHSRCCLVNISFVVAGHRRKPSIRRARLHHITEPNASAAPRGDNFSIGASAWKRRGQLRLRAARAPAPATLAGMCAQLLPASRVAHPCTNVVIEESISSVTP